MSALWYGIAFGDDDGARGRSRFEDEENDKNDSAWGLLLELKTASGKLYNTALDRTSFAPSNTPEMLKAVFISGVLTAEPSLIMALTTSPWTYRVAATSARTMRCLFVSLW